MLDKYVWGDVDRISPEAPVPVLRASHYTSSPGGAANVAMNLAGLGVQVAIAGIVGDDPDGIELQLLLKSARIRADLLVVRGGPTTTKTRVIGGHQQMLRIDVEDTRAIGAMDDEPLSAWRDAVAMADVVVLSDYAKGALTPAVCRGIVQAAQSRGIPVVAGPKGRDFHHYAGALVLCPNLRELAAGLGQPAEDIDGLLHAAQTRVCQLGVEYLVVTMGDKGIAVVRPSSILRAPARARQVFDVSGAGDTVLATLAIALTSGLPIEPAVDLANVAAGIVVGKVGTVAIQRHELLAELSSEVAPDAQNKILRRDELLARVAAWRANGDAIVFTNGCFDLLHVGHLALIEAARREGARLIVAINSDDSVRRLKGNGRPVIRESDRARMLAALAAVDAVTIFTDDTPLALILEIRPEVIVKGGDYTESEVVGHQEVGSWKGRVKIVPTIGGFSTSGLIARMANGTATGNLE